jgi:hypothetical protein
MRGSSSLPTSRERSAGSIERGSANHLAGSTSIPRGRFDEPPLATRRLSEGEAQKISIFVKCRRQESGDRGVKQHKMKSNNVDMSEENQRELATELLKQAAHRELATGVLKQAAQDFRRFHGAKSKIERELYFDAYRWLTIDECSSPFSFLNVCQLLNLAPDDVRQELIGDLSAGAFNCWFQRCRRGAGRLRMSFSQLFISDRSARTTLSIGPAEATDIVFHRTNSFGGAV